MNQHPRPMYITAGNFPSIAANTIQVAKMSSAYSEYLPGLEVVALSGLWSLWRRSRIDLQELYALPAPLRVRYLPLLPRQRDELFGESYRPPKWFPRLGGRYARLRRARLVFTRKDGTALETIRGNIPTVLETHVGWEHSPLLQANLEWLKREAFKALVTVTDGLAESFIRAGVPEDKVIVEPDGVDLAQFKRNLTKKKAREELELGGNGTTCVYAGHLYEGRGIEDIIEAAALLPEVQFLVVGGWPGDVEKYRQLSKERQLRNIVFQGHVAAAKVPVYLYAADILLMPHSSHVYHAERTSPLKMFEYMASGRPIIASDLQAFHPVLRNKENSVLVQPDSPRALADAIQELLRSPHLAAALGEKAKDDVRNYTWHDRAKRILAGVYGRN